MFNELIDSGAGLAILLITIIFGGIGFAVLFNISDHMVQNSGYAPLQQIYQSTKPIVTTASDVQDWLGFAKAVLIIIGLVVSLVLGIKYLPSFLDDIIR